MSSHLVVRLEASEIDDRVQLEVDDWTDHVLEGEVRSICEIFAETTRHREVVGEIVLPLWIQELDSPSGIIWLPQSRQTIRVEGALRSLEHARRAMDRIGFSFFVFSPPGAAPILQDPNILLGLSEIAEKQVLGLLPRIVEICLKHPQFMPLKEAWRLWLDPEFQGCDSAKMTDLVAAARKIDRHVDADLKDVNFLAEDGDFKFVLACTQSNSCIFSKLKKLENNN